MTPQLAQRLRVDAKHSRHSGGGHPISFEHRCSGSILNRWRRIRASALQSRPADAKDLAVLLQLLILQNTGGWTLEGDASEQLEALFKQEQEDKLSDAMADVLELCRERWKDFKRTTRKDVVQHCDSFKDKDRKALLTLRSLEGKQLLESKAETTDNGTEIAFKPTE